jgi:hypothetical protein
MDTILMAVTAISLAMVVGMAGVLARMLREERRRSDARVALLTELASERGGLHHPRADAMASAVADLALRPAAPAVEAAALFLDHERPSPWPRRLAVVGAMVVIGSIVTFGWSALTRDAGSRAAASASPAQPLELLSLSHAQEAGSITISGRVQNPRGGQPLVRVDATVLVFGSDGTLQATGRAPLDIVTLAPGEESRFVVRVPVTGPPGRYRVAFRGENDRALGHIDRRDPDAIARKQEP